MNTRNVLRGAAKVIPRRGNNIKIADMGPRVENPQQLNQDVPPPGGYPSIRLRRNMPNKFWSIGTFLFISTTLMAYGWYRYYQWIKKKE